MYWVAAARGARADAARENGVSTVRRGRVPGGDGVPAAKGRRGAGAAADADRGPGLHTINSKFRLGDLLRSRKKRLAEEPSS